MIHPEVESHDRLPEISSSASTYHKMEPASEISTLKAPQTSSPSPTSDLICIGCGPATLAIASALVESSPSPPSISILERQPQFAWHSGMQLPGARMQISFLKDLATPRNPRSKFTFTNYLFCKGRLQHFTNLGTFSPSRAEFEDYLRWCAGEFEQRGCVTYGTEVLEVAPVKFATSGKVTQFKVVSRDVKTGQVTTRVASNVVIAVGGKALMPSEFPVSHPKVIHSSTYSNRLSDALPDPSKAYNIVVIGGGQSAAEIFNDLPSRYPNAKVTIMMKGAALRPSDDSPFVNEVFDPERVSEVYNQPPAERAKKIKADRATNYSVVRLDLIEHLYDRMYQQRREKPDPESWKVRMKTNTRVVNVETGVGSEDRLRLTVVVNEGCEESESEEMVVDAVFVATGYMRNAHEGMLAGTRSLLRERDQAVGTFPVTRDYKVDFDESKVAKGSGVWLQGCNEKTHGLSDTLLSIVAVRGGEMVRSMFGDAREELNVRAKL